MTGTRPEISSHSFKPDVTLSIPLVLSFFFLLKFQIGVADKESSTKLPLLKSVGEENVRADGDFNKSRIYDSSELFCATQVR